MMAKTKTRGQKHLEITMRDVLDGLEDAASYMNYNSVPNTVEILSIEPAGRLTQSQQEVFEFNSINNPKYSTNIVDYLVQRKLKKSA